MELAARGQSGTDAKNAAPGASQKVIVVGAGISGLSAAFDLAAAGADCTILEKQPRAGGVIETRFADGCTLECGPDSFLSAKPAALTLIKELGLERRIGINPAGPKDDPLNSGVQRGGITLIEPLGYLEFMKLVAHAKLVLTDSGGLQEETTILGIPCLTLRKNTERPVTVAEGTNTLVGMDPERIVECSLRALRGGDRRSRRPQFWDGQAARRVIDVLLAGRRPGTEGGSA